MFVCICEAVTEDEVTMAVMAGADTVEKVTAATFAGSCCGTCEPTIENVIKRTCPIRTDLVDLNDAPCPRRDLFAAQLTA